MDRFNIVIAVLILITFAVSNANETTKNDSVPAGTGIGQIPELGEVTRLGKNLLLAEYMPLDKGNVWTYTVKKGDQIKEHTHSVVSESGGWSVFDNYFGKDAIALRIAPGGELLVTNKGVVSTFYSDEVTASFPRGTVETPGGKYDQAMLVTMPEDKEFWFRDVYVKGVGLVFHEHKTPEGNTSYSLLKAKVRGNAYPPE
jgi:hypothetical protein